MTLASNRVARIESGERPVPLPVEDLKEILTQGASYTDQHLVRAGVTPSQHEFFKAISELDRIQTQIGNKNLADFATKLVCEHFGITPRDVNIDAKLITPQELPPPLNAPDIQSPIRTELRPELNKRLFQNAIIQGVAHGVQYRFLFETNQCESLHPSLAASSRKLMALGDASVWTIDERRMNFNFMPPAGLVNLDFSSSPITIKAQALHFPVLVHEIAKGVAEWLALSGLPRDRRAREDVLKHADHPQQEAWGITIGAELWRRISKGIPTTLTPIQRTQELQKFLSLPTTEFLQRIETLSKSQCSKV